jgi:hypothetical protein
MEAARAAVAATLAHPRDLIIKAAAPTATCAPSASATATAPSEGSEAKRADDDDEKLRALIDRSPFKSGLSIECSREAALDPAKMAASDIALQLKEVFGSGGPPGADDMNLDNKF